jgi:hypothetical protein
VALQLQDIQKCNKQLSASTIKHAATRTYKDKWRAHLIKALHTSADAQQQQQQQHLEGFMTQTLQKELVDKVSAAVADVPAIAALLPACSVWWSYFADFHAMCASALIIGCLATTCGGGHLCLLAFLASVYAMMLVPHLTNPCSRPPHWLLTASSAAGAAAAASSAGCM